MNRIVKSLTTLALIVVLACLTLGVAQATDAQASQYQAAVTLVEADKLDLALPLFEHLGDYEDSARYAMYIDALLKYRSGQYSEAVLLLIQLENEGFLDSAELLDQVASHLIDEAPPEATPTPEPDAPDYYAIVHITKSGYMNVRKSPTDSSTVFRVHYGERYLCTGIVDDWYEIQLPTQASGYIQSDAASINLMSDLEQLPFSVFYMKDTFEIKTTTKAEVYSQPRSSAKMRRVSDSGEATFYYSKNATLTCCGSTVRDGRAWYLLLCNNNGTFEMGWIRADTCTVESGNPDSRVIPAQWYD